MPVQGNQDQDAAYSPGIANTGDTECQLVGGGFAMLLQVLLGIAALSALIIKRWREHEKRPIKIWAYDTSKQVVGALFVHGWNIVLSMVLADLLKSTGRSEAVDECALYFVSFFLDCVFGLFILWAIVKLQELFAQRRNIPALLVSGDYGTPPKFSWYRLQLLAYILNMALTKTIISVLVITMHKPLTIMSNKLFEPVSKYPDVELTVVMIVCPWLLNSCQFWVVDNILMSSRGGEGGNHGMDDSDLKYMDVGARRGSDGSGCSDSTDGDGGEGGRREGEPDWVNGTKRLPKVVKRAGGGGGATLSPTLGELSGSGAGGYSDYVPRNRTVV